MVGANCCIFGCSSSRRKSGVAVFKVPQGGNEGVLTGGKALSALLPRIVLLIKP